MKIRTVSPAQARQGVPDIVSGTEKEYCEEFGTQGMTGIEPSMTGTEPGSDEMMSLVNQIVTNVHAYENSN